MSPRASGRVAAAEPQLRRRTAARKTGSGKPALPEAPSPDTGSARSDASFHTAAERHLRRVDARLGAVVERVGPCKLRPRIDAGARADAPWAALARAIVFQQLNGRAASTIFGRVLALFPDGELPAPARLLELPDGELRACGLSAAKTAALKDLAAKTIDGVVPSSRELLLLTDVEIVERITAVRGVGPWTVQMMLMFDLGRPDVLPSRDLGVLQGFARVHGRRERPDPRELERYAERWRPHRTVASWYLWRALELG